MKRIFGPVFLFLLLFFTAFGEAAQAQTKAPLRRPISPQQPMWIVHIDTWNYADPQKIIDMIPKDIRPFVVMDISLSINHDENTGRFMTVEYGYETAKSWVRTCAENRMWAMVQPASGGFCQFSDFDLTVFDEFYREYPNFIGFNYAEQFWGFDDKFSVTWPQRINHFTNLMKLNQKYGGYLVVSWCGAFYGASINPIAMMKRNADFAAVCKEDPEHFIICEKFTSAYGFSDIESTCLGTWLSGYSGHYGIRFDQCGWVPTDTIGEKTFPPAAGIAPVVEHLMLTGETVMDGPELIWQQDFKNVNNSTTPDGFSMRRWEYFPQFPNISIDIFRKVLDGTIPLMSRKEVIDRSKVVLVNDVTTGNDQNKYSSPDNLYEGLYRADGDGPMMSNLSWFKKTGRYPAIPVVYQLADSLAKTFKLQVKKSLYPSRWPSSTSKVNDFNLLFPQEYTGDMYAARQNNGWVVYNPKKTGMGRKYTVARGSIPFQYNTCERIDLVLNQYSAGVIREYADKLTCYLNNYDNVNTSLKNDTLRIFGSNAEPSYTFKDRAVHAASTVTKSWSGEVFTLVVTHNGPLDLTINCSGSATDRLAVPEIAAVVAPELPDVYTGPRQYEAENFDSKNIQSLTTNGVYGSIRNYTGQGYLKFGTNSAAIIRDSVYVHKAGTYSLRIRYTAPSSALSVQLRVNGTKRSVSFPKTASESAWNYMNQSFVLKEGLNILQVVSLGSSYPINFDHFILERADGGTYNFTDDTANSVATNPAAAFVSVRSGSAGVVAFTDALGVQGQALKTYSNGSKNQTGCAGLDLFPRVSTDYTVEWKEYHSAKGGCKGVLLRANGSSSYADGMKQGYLFVAENNADETVTLKSYVVGAEQLVEKASFTSVFQVLPGQPLWLRATANGSAFRFECSKDGIRWWGGEAAFTDNSYALGSTDLVWGLGSDSCQWVVDDLAVKTPVMSASVNRVDGFTYLAGSGPSATGTVYVTGKDLLNDVKVTAPYGYEVSASASGSFDSTLVLSPSSGTLNAQPVFIRLRAGGTVGICRGTLTIGTPGLDTLPILLNGNISARMQYTFQNDLASTYAQAPPAANVSIGVGNGSTAGVASAPVSGDKAFRAYSGGERNGTGAASLNLFPAAATEYSVSWKYTFGTASTDYKVGLLLRGSSPATTSTGYTAGLMQGYLFLLYHNTGRTTSEFRIYKPVNTNTSLDRLATGTMSFSPTVGTPFWMRATTSGSGPVNLKFEYSTDSLNWVTATSTTDATAPYLAGATQVVWGLAASGMDFYLDNITFTGSTGTLAPVRPVRDDTAEVVSTEYYTVSGMRVSQPAKGLYIVRERLSDGSMRSSKVLYLGDAVH